MPALYALEEGLYRPGPLTVGPWSPDAQHGGPVAALLARAVESVPAEQPMQVVRITVELLRPVPVTPLAVSAELSRPGKKVQLVEASVSSPLPDGGAIEVARARALRIRAAPTPGIPEDRSEPPAPPPPDDEPPAAPTVRRTAFADAVELRFVRGGWDELGPVTMWTRLIAEVVEGESPSPLQRTAAAADFGNGVSRIVDFDTHIFINPDLTVALGRLPRGAWIGFDVTSRFSEHGYGQSESRIFDGDGTIGRSVQSLILEERF